MNTGTAVADQLRDAINSGRWPPGAALRQEELASEFQVSRIPVRDALGVLQAEGLVRIEPNRGAFVTAFTPKGIDEIFDLRVLLEADLLRRAVSGHTSLSLRRLQSLQVQLDVEESPPQWILLDREFHQVLYRPAERPHTLALIDSLRTPIERFCIVQISPGTRRGDWSREHHALLKAVRNLDADNAAALLAQHLRSTQKVVIQKLLELRSSEPAAQIAAELGSR